MSHPAASIRSIISGKTNFDNSDLLEQGDFMNCYTGSSNYENDSGTGSFNFNRTGTYSDDNSSKFSRDSSYNNLRAFGESLEQKKKSEDFVYRSGDVEQEHATPPPDQFLSSLQDPVSRPISRNSTTSCLSTTATKDGIEGKRFHRQGPTLYSSNIITNMMQQQREQQQKDQKDQLESVSQLQLQLQEGQNYLKPTLSPPLRPDAFDSSDGVDPNISQVSIHTTNAELDGDSGISQYKRETLFEKTFAKVQPVTFNEKMNMINTNPLSEKEN